MTDRPACPHCKLPGQVIDPSTAKCVRTNCDVQTFRLDRPQNDGMPVSKPDRR